MYLGAYPEIHVSIKVHFIQTNMCMYLGQGGQTFLFQETSQFFGLYNQHALSFLYFTVYVSNLGALHPGICCVYLGVHHPEICVCIQEFSIQRYVVCIQVLHPEICCVYLGAHHPEICVYLGAYHPDLAMCVYLGAFIQRYVVCLQVQTTQTQICGYIQVRTIQKYVVCIQVHTIQLIVSIQVYSIQRYVV